MNIYTGTHTHTHVYYIYIYIYIYIYVCVCVCVCVCVRVCVCVMYVLTVDIYKVHTESTLILLRQYYDSHINPNGEALSVRPSSDNARIVAVKFFDSFFSNWSMYGDGM